MILLVKKSDKQAFDEIYERYWFKMYLAAVKRIKSDENAKDLVQDLFVSLWARRDTLVINNSLQAYLYQAIKFKIINYIEANVVKSNYLKSLDKFAFEYDDSTSESIVCNDLEQFIEAEINNLSPRVKEVFEMSRKERLTNVEIAQKLNVSEQTVKNQISKAIKTLKLHLDNVSISFMAFIILNSYFI